MSTHGQNLVNAVQAQPTANQPLISLAPSSISIGDALTQNPTFVVCDISAAVTECLYLNVPIMLFDPSLPSLPTQKIREMYPGCYLFKNAEELNSLLVEVILKVTIRCLRQERACLHIQSILRKQKTVRFFRNLIEFPELVTQKTLIKSCAS